MNMSEMKVMSDPSEIDMMISALQKIRKSMGERSAKQIGPQEHETRIEIIAGAPDDEKEEMSEEGKTLDDIPSPSESNLKKGRNHGYGLPQG